MQGYGQWKPVFWHISCSEWVNNGSRRSSVLKNFTELPEKPSLRKLFL